MFTSRSLSGIQLAMAMVASLALVGSAACSKGAGTGSGFTITPATPGSTSGAPAAPVGIGALAGDGQATISWTPSTGATGYNLYWDTAPGVSPATSQVITGILSPFVHTGLTNGISYHYLLTAVNQGLESAPSVGVSATPSPPATVAPPAPTGVSVSVGDARVTLRWAASAGATSHNIYWSTQPGVTPLTGSPVRGVASPFTHSGLTNGATYYYVVTASIQGLEGGPSAEVSAVPQPSAATLPPPSGLGVSAGDAQVTLTWTGPPGATAFNVYWSTSSGVTPATGNRIANVSSPFTHQGLVNGITIHYVVTALQGSRESAASSPANAMPTAVVPSAPGPPSGVSATAGNGQNTLAWSASVGATSYTIYWSTMSGVSPSSGVRIAGVSSPFVHAGLANGSSYFYVVTATGAGGESSPSAQVFATPQAATPIAPAIPAGLSARPADGVVTLSWNASIGATSYNIYWSLQSGAAPNAGRRIGAVRSPTAHTGLSNGTTYYYVVTAVRAGVESAASGEVAATPRPATPTPPAVPTALNAVTGNGQVTLSWNASPGATSHNLYWSTRAGVTPAQGNVIRALSSPFTHASLTNGLVYYYVVTAVRQGIESPPSSQVSATPTAPMPIPPPPPVGVQAVAGDAQVTLSWPASPGASSYNIYWANGSTVSSSSGRRISGVSSPYVHAGLTNGSIYAYVITALNQGLESPASPVTRATPRGVTPPPPTAPMQVAAVAGAGQVTLMWRGGPRSTSYDISWSNQPNVRPGAAASIPGVTSPFAHRGLVNGRSYYYVVTARNGTVAGPPSAEVSATPAAPVPAWAPLGSSDAPGGLSNAPLFSGFPDLALDNQEHPVIAWQQETASGWEVFVKRWDGSAWSELAGSASGGGLSGSAGTSMQAVVATDLAGRVVVAWTEHVGRNNQVYLKRWSGSRWEELAGSASGGGISDSGDHASDVSLAIDPAGRPVVAWEQVIPGSWPRRRQIYLERWTGLRWEELAGSASGGGISGTAQSNSQYPSLAIDRAGRPAVAWLEGAPRQRVVHFRHWNGQAWEALGSSVSATGISGYTVEDGAPPLALDAAGRPSVAWSTQNSAGEWQIFMRRWNGSSWQALAGSGAGGGLSHTAAASRSPDLAVDLNTGNPTVIWHDSSGPGRGWDVYLRRWNGQAWVEVAGSANGSGLTGGTTGSSQIPSLALDRQGRPAVAWEEGATGTMEILFRRFR